MASPRALLPRQVDLEHLRIRRAAAAGPHSGDSAYERRKCEQALEVIQGLKRDRVLELACADGHFTRLLAPQVTSLLATNPSPAALTRAQQRCARFSNISYAGLDVFEDPIPGTFDLIVCSQLAFAHEIRTPLYRIQVFRRERSRPWPLHRRRAARIEEAACETPEPGAAAHIRWERRRSDAAYDTARLPILMYHRCAPSGGERLARYRVRPEAFEQQLRYLRDHDYRTTTFADWRAARAAKRPLRGRRVILTFDDGFADFAEFAWPLLQRYGFGATVFLVAGRIGGTSDWDSAYGDTAALMDWNQILDLQAQGIEFGSHTINHRHLPALSPAEAATELLQSRLSLEQRLERPVRSLAYPFGQYEPWLQHLVGACGYLDAVTTRSMLSTLEDTDLALARVEGDGRAGIDDFVRSLRD